MSSNADARIRSFIERILRLKDEQDALGVDIREVYKEAASEGFNKTALGKVVTMLRARQRDADKLAALESDVALYLSAYDGTRIAPTHVRDPLPPSLVEFDPDTGEIIEPAVTEPSAPSQGDTGSIASEPSSDAVPAADVALTGQTPGQSEQAPDPIPVQPHIVRDPVDLPDIPDFLRRTMKTAEAAE